MEEYRALAGIAKADYYPWVGYDASASRQKQPIPGTGQVPTYNTFAVGAGVSWEIDLWGRIRRSNESALNQLLATEEARRGVTLSLVTGVAQAYLELRELDLELEIAERTLESRKGSFDLVTKKLLGGISNKLESSQAESAAGADRGGDPAAQAGDLRQGEPAVAPSRAAAGTDPAGEDPRRERSLRPCRRGCRRRC